MDKSNDCYFYYYSTCTKGKKCPFRHCDLALGSEVVCELWRIGRCKDLNCPFRHMEPNIKRTAIPCWFETQPTGCRKPHCVFQHTKPRPSLMEVQPGQDLILPTGGNSVNLQNLNHNGANQPEIKLTNIESKIPQKSKINISIERDEESDDQENNVEEKEIKDNEVKVKTLEQIRMEKILNSSLDDSIHEIVPMNEDIKSNETLLLLKRPVKSNTSNGIKVAALPLMEGKEDCTFVVKTLDQIRKEREEIENQGDSQDVIEKPTLKENQTPNLLKRSIEIDENSSGSVNSRRPVKIRRNRASTSTSIEITNDMCDQGLQLNDEKTKSTSNEFSNSITLDNKNNLSNVDYTDLDEFDLDDVPANSADANIDSDDELMREIDQVINS